MLQLCPISFVSGKGISGKRVVAGFEKGLVASCA